MNEVLLKEITIKGDALGITRVLCALFPSFIRPETVRDENIDRSKLISGYLGEWCDYNIIVELNEEEN